MADERAARLPGFIAFGGAIPPGLADRVGGERIDGDTVQGLTWGLDVEPDQTLIVSRVRRRVGRSVPVAEVVEKIWSDPASLTELLPPFGSVSIGRDRLRVVVDSMGFQPIFHREAGTGATGVVSNSALVVGWSSASPLDQTAVGVQSLLGWQLGQRTLFRGVRKLSPGSIGTLDRDGLEIEQAAHSAGEPIDLVSAVRQSATLMRTALNQLLDENPDAVLQLTGGLDSRLLLSAIPESRRRGLRAMTLSVPSSGDATIAGSIAQRYGIDHEVRGLADLDHVSPDQAWELACAEAIRLDAMSDPVALAAQRVAERNFSQGVRISGLGGEVARGFYYVGRVRDRRYTRADAEKLAAWRMFVNEAVEPGLLTDEFSSWARRAAVDSVYEALRAGGDEWFTATDELYLRHRMQRWAGATDVAVSNWRTVINPMLEHEFLDIASRLSPQDKANSRFLAGLQVELDSELGRMPLDGRPAPIAYAHPSRREPALMALRTGRRLVRKALQRVRRGNRPPVGGEIFAGKIVEHIRSNPDLIRPVASQAFVDQRWIEKVLAGEIEPRPSSIALIVNLTVALDAA